jgi:autonomous glycyl radical cofactor GrcA
LKWGPGCDGGTPKVNICDIRIYSPQRRSQLTIRVSHEQLMLTSVPAEELRDAVPQSIRD